MEAWFTRSDARWEARFKHPADPVRDLSPGCVASTFDLGTSKPHLAAASDAEDFDALAGSDDPAVATQPRHDHMSASDCAVTTTDVDPKHDTTDSLILTAASMKSSPQHPLVPLPAPTPTSPSSPVKSSSLPLPPRNYRLPSSYQQVWRPELVEMPGMLVATCWKAQPKEAVELLDKDGHVKLPGFYELVTAYSSNKMFDSTKVITIPEKGDCVHTRHSMECIARLHQPPRRRVTQMRQRRAPHRWKFRHLHAPPQLRPPRRPPPHPKVHHCPAQHPQEPTRVAAIVARAELSHDIATTSIINNNPMGEHKLQACLEKLFDPSFNPIAETGSTDRLVIEQVTPDPQFVSLAEHIGNPLVQDLVVSSELEERMSCIKNDLPLKLILVANAIENGGPFAMARHRNDPGVLHKFGQAMGVNFPGNFSAATILSGPDKTEEESGRAEESIVHHTASVGDMISEIGGSNLDLLLLKILSKAAGMLSQVLSIASYTGEFIHDWILGTYLQSLLLRTECPAVIELLYSSKLNSVFLSGYKFLVLHIVTLDLYSSSKLDWKGTKLQGMHPSGWLMKEQDHKSVDLVGRLLKTVSDLQENDSLLHHMQSAGYEHTHKIFLDASLYFLKLGDLEQWVVEELNEQPGWWHCPVCKPALVAKRGSPEIGTINSWYWVLRACCQQSKYRRQFEEENRSCNGADD